MKRPITRLSLAVALALAGAGTFSALSARADTVFLEGGGRVRGEIIAETSTTVTVKTPLGGVNVIRRDEIARIERDQNPEQEHEARSKKLSPTDADGWFELGKFASQKGLKDKAEADWKKAIAIDGDHAGAREALGYRKYKGRWYDAAGYKKAVEGLVEWNGQWVTPADKEMYEQGFIKDSDGKWITKEDLARREAEKKAAEERAKEALKKKPKEDPEPSSTPPAEGMTGPRGGGGGAAGGGGVGPDGKPKAAPIEPEDDSWYDDHATVKSWEETIKSPPYESQFYQIYSNIKPEYVKRYGMMMDTYNKMGFQRVFNAAENLKHGFPKGKLYIYPSHEAFMKGENEPEGVGGFYQPGGNFVKCYHGRFGMTGTTREVLTHEGTHQFEDLVIPGKMWNAPIWIIEGFAVFFESALYDQKANTVKIGSIPHDRLMNLKQGIAADKYIHLPELIRTPQPAFTGYHYAHAWSLIYFMIYGGKSDYQRKTNQKVFSDLFFLARSEVITPEKCESLWGGADKFKAWEEQWKQWILDLPYDFDPKEALEQAKREKAEKKGDGKDDGKDGAGAGKKGGPTETPDPGQGQGQGGEGGQPAAPPPAPPAGGDGAKPEPKKDEPKTPEEPKKPEGEGDRGE